MGTIATKVAFVVGGVSYSVDDVVQAARLWGEWAQLESQVGQGLACVQRADDTGEDVADGEVEAAASEFRYARDLIAGQDMEAWLAHWHLSLEQWTAYLRRTLLRARWSDALPEIVARHPVPQDDVAAEAMAEAICSGVLARVARTLAGHAAAYAKARAEGWIPDERGLAAGPDEPAQLDGLAAAFEQFREHVVTPKALNAHLAAHALDWVQVDYLYVAFPTENVAREAVLCVRDDGLDLDAVAAAATTVATEHRAYLEEVDEPLRGALLGSLPGELIGPLAGQGEFVLAHVRDKVLPSLDDPGVRRRASESVIQAAVEHEVRDRVDWRLGM